MSSPLFSFGTSRGGTTFFARILSNSNDVNMASDPFMPIYRGIRNGAMSTIIDDFDTKKPLEDYYFNKEGLIKKNAISSFDLNNAYPADNLETLKEQLKDRVKLAAPELSNHIHMIGGSNYKDIFDSAINVLTNTYGKDTKWIGSNDNWVIEFLPHLAKSYPKAKFIIIIRDPRGAFASSRKVKEVNPKVVPLAFSFIRHVRKHMDYAMHYKKDKELSKRIFLLRYEDLVSEPAALISRLCEFLEITYSDNMLDTDKFRPISGNKWEKNSQFNVPDVGIYTQSAEGWKNRLDKNLIELVEFICGPEMRYFGYETLYNKGCSISQRIFDFLEKDANEVLGWQNQYGGWLNEISNELLRNQILRLNTESTSLDLIESNYMFPSVHELLSSNKRFEYLQ
jgi:hypothetical protein